RVLLCDADNLATIQSYIHKHPHELLDSVVKERFDQAFRLNRGCAFYSSLSRCQAVFSKISFLLNRLPLRSIFISRQREANHTAFKTAVNHLFHRFRSIRPKPPTGLNHHPASPAHSTRIRHQRNPQFQSNFLIYKNFQQRTAPEVVRIIGG
ncbi:MAG: hypothetical protein ACYCW7_09755, partial [Pseudomonadaceae bacterium]